MNFFCFSCRNIFYKKNIGSRVSVSVSDFKGLGSEGVVSVSNGQVSVSDDEVSVSNDEAETPSLDKANGVGIFIIPIVYDAAC